MQNTIDVFRINFDDDSKWFDATNHFFILFLFGIVMRYSGRSILRDVGKNVSFQTIKVFH